MPAGEPGSSVYLSQPAIIEVGNSVLPGPGPQTVMNWTDLQNRHASFGSMIHIENTGAAQIDSITIRASYQPTGAYYMEVNILNPIPVGQSVDVALPGAIQTNPPPYGYVEVSNAAPTSCHVTIVNMNG